MSAAREPGEPRSSFERALARRRQAQPDAQAERVAALVSERMTSRARRRWLTGRRLVVAGVGIGTVALLFGGPRGRRGNEPIGAAAVATAEGAGVGSSVSGFLPQSDSRAVTPSHGSAPSAPSEPAPASLAAPAVPTAGAAGRRRPAPTATPVSREALAGLPVLADGRSYAAEVGTSAAEVSAPAATSTPVVNVGTRVQARLEASVRTGASLVPVTAVLTEDVRVGERVLLPAGARLVGSAFATPQDDRVQILWRAVVQAGRTWPFEGETLGADGAPGLVGKLITRRRKGVLRRIGSAVAGVAADTAGVAAPFGDGLLDRTGTALVGRAGSDLRQFDTGREWLQADSVVELKAGITCTIFVAADLRFEAPTLPTAP